MRIFWDNEINEDATLSVSSNEAANPKRFLYDSYLSNFWLATGNTSEYVQIDAGSGNTIDVNAVGIAGHNLTSGATIKIQGNATDSWTSPSLDETITWQADTIMHFRASTAQYRYFRLSLADSGNSSNIQIGHLFFGTYLQMPGFSSNVQIQENYEATRNINRAGGVKGSMDYYYRTVNVRFVDMTNSKRNDILTMMRSVYNYKPIYCAVWENDLTFEPPIYGVISGTAIQSLKSRGTTFTFPLQIREVR